MSESIKYPSRLLIDPETTACFSGHRPEKLPFDVNHQISLEAFKSVLYLHIHEAYLAGYRTFITGMARGFDTIAAMTVLKYCLRFNVTEKINLVGVSPFMEEIRRIKGNDLYNYCRLLDSCDEMIYLHKDYQKGCFHERNRYMVDHSSLLICACASDKGGTASTMKYAKKKGLKIDNIDMSEFCGLSDLHYQLPENGIIELHKHRPGTVTRINLPHPFSSLNNTQDDEKKQ